MSILSVLYTQLGARLQEAADFASAKDANLEVEVRFTDLPISLSEKGVPREWKSQIAARTFQRLKSALLQTHGEKVIFEQTTDATIAGLRRTKDLLTGKVAAIHKHRKVTTGEGKHPNYPIALGVAVEETVAIPTGEVTSTREKQRWRFPLQGSRSRMILYLDLTQASQYDLKQRQTPITLYEMELEVTFPASTYRSDHPVLTDLSDLTTQYLQQMLDTEHLYTLQQRQELVIHYNTWIRDSRQSNPLPILTDRLNPKATDRSQSTAQARNLKIRDCVEGGLLNSLVRIDGSSTPVQVEYSVTVKAAGHRKQLILHSTGIWLTYPPMEMNRILPADQMHPELREYIGAVLDGENVVAERRRIGRTATGGEIPVSSARYFYLPFDVMAWQGQAGKLPINHFKRLQLRNLLIGFLGSRVNPRLLELYSKIYHPIGDIRDAADLTMPGAAPRVPATTDQLQKTLRKAKEEEQRVPFHTDGLLLTPIQTLVNPRSDQYPLKQRVLTVHPDICKLKDWKDLTLDAVYTNGTIQVGRKTGYTVTNVPFGETATFPFDPEIQLDRNHPLLRNLAAGTVIEFGPVRLADGTIQLVPQLLRTEKPFPNLEEIANDVWADINRPLTFETLQDQKLDLAIAYHNQIKASMYASIPAGAHVVDIGAGRGGDLGKQVHLGRVLSVEPYHGEAFRVRLAQRQERARGRWIPSYRLLEVGGEKTREIVEAAREHFLWEHAESRAPLHITMMLSLSFFWSSPKMLRGLAATLQGLTDAYSQSGGTIPVVFHFLTIESRGVVELLRRLQPDWTPKLPIQWQLNSATFAFEPPNVIHVNITDSIVTDQKEYLVDLLKLMELLSLKPTGKAVRPGQLEIHRADGSQPLDMEMAGTRAYQPLLGPIERDYSSMYAFGKAILTPGVNPPSRKSVTSTRPPVPAIADDTVTRLPSTSPGEYYRVSCPRDGCSFFHALLKMTSAEYTTAGTSQRHQMAITLRRDLADLLALPMGEGTYHQALEIETPLTEISDRLRSELELTAEELNWLPSVIGVDLTLHSPSSLQVVARYRSDRDLQLHLLQNPDGSTDCLGYRPTSSGELSFTFK